MKIGIVGLPNVGKSTLFKALTRKQIDISNYPFCTINPNIGVVSVPDKRLDELAKISKSKKIIPAAIEVVDIAGIVKGANKGEGLGNQFLANIREVDAIVHVVRSFANSKIIHVEGGVDPQRDVDIINIELALKDLESVEKRIIKRKKDINAQDKEAIAEMPILKKLRDILADGKPLNEVDLPDDKQAVSNLLQLLTIKPVIFLINGLWEENPYKENSVEADLLTEAEMADLSAEEAKELRGEEESKLNDFIRKAYDVLGYITFFTTGEDETRAWQIPEGALAPQAAGAIHTDFERGFIRAEVVYWNDLIEFGGWSKVRAAGKLRSEGKEYKVKDGDVLEFKFNK